MSFLSVNGKFRRFPAVFSRFYMRGGSSDFREVRIVSLVMSSMMHTSLLDLLDIHLEGAQIAREDITPPP